MSEKYLLDIVINREKLSDGSPIFVSHCLSLGLASQGKDVEEAMNNIREAVQLYLEEQPEKYAELVAEEAPVFSVIEVTPHAKVASSVW